MAEDKKRRLDADLLNAGAVAMPFIIVKRAILQALDGDRQSTRQARGIDRKAFIPEQLAPMAESDTTQHARPNQCEESFPPVHVQ